MISWLAYESIIKNKKNVLPDFGTISNELWIIILLFLFQVLNNLTFSSEDSEKRKEHYLKTRHNTFRNKYGKLVSDLTPNVRVEALVYSIMIYEDFNRPKAIRIIENVKFRATRKPMTLGVMQVRSEEFIDDFGSVKKGVEKLVSDLREVLQENNNGGRSTYHTMEILSSVIKKFNGGKSYNKEISDLFWIVWLKIYGGTTEISFAD